MKKMPCLFQREFHGKSQFTITEMVTPGCEWVLAGEGVASRKWDGTACAVIDGRLYKRYDAKKNPKTGEYKLPPVGAVPCDDPDPVTGHWPHWLRVDMKASENKHHAAAWQELVYQKYGMLLAEGEEPKIDFDRLHNLLSELPNDRLNSPVLENGTYELIGPPINGNAECVDSLMFKRHGAEVREVPRTFHGLRTYLQEHAIEGLVFAHSDGRMCKIRRHDFGFAWGSKS